MKLDWKRNEGRSLEVVGAKHLYCTSPGLALLKACPQRVPETLGKGVYEVKTMSVALLRHYLPFSLILPRVESGVFLST